MKPSNTNFKPQPSARGSIRPLQSHQLRIKPSTIFTAAFTLLISFNAMAFTGPEVQKVLEQTFQKNFPNAKNIHWESDANDGYTVSFTVENILTRISYDKKGKFVSSVRYYSGQMLPFNLTDMLKERFPNKEIYGVAEVTNSTDINYYVKLEGPKTWTTVRIDNDGNAYVTEKYNKAE